MNINSFNIPVDPYARPELRRKLRPAAVVGMSSTCIGMTSFNGKVEYLGARDQDGRQVAVIFTPDLARQVAHRLLAAADVADEMVAQKAAADKVLVPAPMFEAIGLVTVDVDDLD